MAAGRLQTKIFFSLVLVLIIGGYTLYEMRNVILGPTVSISSPATGTRSTEQLITVEGIARNISRISLNDRPIFVDESGVFKEQLLLPFGYSIMTLKASDRFGRETIKTLELVYQ
ncbi:hypothetical protein COU17_03130 [Candidatus Kaiserbacteria bacterium CG10_big_fil_rev_8_21_14_0_10_49_17]|uniref:IPT/TIG domain-containing protein n=1 Tax=Candidatus Kaiserbacteria bacterium CG10_big_fil_rev_8_21_14_0_10_49_17 TaxID=1974609 RepID=A0A2M6WDV7_9BACT|nr:MAG: hypothetical protein COU17_03130 [Candidatus Kaiserbacteria bacterium CG10_big_fil_rev_8_21_14_0_10_49_17]